MLGMEKILHTELSKRKSSGRANVKEPPQINLLMRSPNENLTITSADQRRPTFDDLTFTQFLRGFADNLLEVTDMKMRNAMLIELVEVIETTERSNWATARDVFSEGMTKIEQGIMSWTDTMELLQTHMSAGHGVVLAQQKSQGRENRK